AFVVDLVGGRGRAELRRLADSDDAGASAGAAAGATELLRALAPVPTDHLTIRVLGPLQLERGGVELRDAGLRRTRVRQLLALLVTERVARREQVIDQLWPDMTKETASQNLRVTLAHLRRFIEPERAAG